MDQENKDVCDCCGKENWYCPDCGILTCNELCPNCTRKMYRSYGFYRKWINIYGENIGGQLFNHMIKELLKAQFLEEAPPRAEKYQCVDNIRCCLIGNKEQEEIYKEQYEDGCCGFKDWEVEVEGKTYKIGFNYGH